MKRYLLIFAVLVFMALPFATAVGAESETEADIPTELSDVTGTQAILVKSVKGGSAFACTAEYYEKQNDGWTLIMSMPGVLGKSGIAAQEKKVEGDKKTPSGMYAIGTGFGPEKPLVTKMNWRVAGKYDYWIDDPESSEYNTWQVEKGDPKTRWKSFERLDIDLYQYAMVIEYNTSPVIKNKGSAIFIHIWKNETTATAGCIAFEKENVIALMRRLDSKQNPVIIISPP